MALYRSSVFRMLPRGVRSLEQTFKKDISSATSYSLYTHHRRNQLVKLRQCVEANHARHLHTSEVRCGLEMRTKPDVSYDELVEMINSKGTFLVDVREPKELEKSGVIPTATNIPLSKLKATLKCKMPDNDLTLFFPKAIRGDQNIVFYGLKNVKGVTALEIARKLGYKKARHYPGGYAEWEQKANAF